MYNRTSDPGGSGMNTNSARPALAAALLLSALWVPAAFAHSSSGHSGGGGHSRGGAHFGSAAHFSGGAHYSGGYGGAGRVSSGGSAHFVTAPGAQTLSASRPTAYVGAGHASGAHWSGANAGVGHAVGAAGLRGRAFGPGYGHLGRWGGGYWGGRFWPGAFYRPGF